MPQGFDLDSLLTVEQAAIWKQVKLSTFRKHLASQMSNFFATTKVLTQIARINANGFKDCPLYIHLARTRAASGVQDQHPCAGAKLMKL